MGQRPLDILNESLNGPVIVKLKDGRVFRGELQGYDIHMNLVMDKTEEVAEGAVARNIGYGNRARRQCKFIFHLEVF